MVEETTVRYRGECNHVNQVTFVAREPWLSKTRGCNQCGQTSQFTEIHEDERGDDNTMIEHSPDSDLNPETAESSSQVDMGTDDDDGTDTEVREDDANEPSLVIREISEPTDVDLEDLSYRELQSVAVETTSVRGNQDGETLVEELSALDDSTLNDAIESSGVMESE